MTSAQQWGTEGKRVLFLTYNALLAEEIRSRVKDVTSVTVFHYHAFCQNAAFLLNALPESDDWSLPKVLRHAIEQEMMPSYDILIIDEAQVFAPPWLEVLKCWFLEKTILACCDETQVFSFKKHTSLLQLKEIMQTEAFTLTTNLRSPYVIFERLQRLSLLPYEQFSPRMKDEDALQEIVTHDLLGTLHAVIRQLHTEGISSHSMMVIYTGRKNPPNYKKDSLPFVPYTTSVWRCRGLEAPLVIVWNNGDLNDTALICAYSRATSRCIAIYHKDHLKEEPTSTSSESAFRLFLQKYSV